MNDTVVLALAAFLQASLRTATPLALAALGELLVERTGLINIGLEGIILAGAFGAFIGGGSGSVLAGFLAAALAGALLAAVFAVVVVVWRGDQIVTGMAITLLALGVTGTLYRTTVNGSTLPPPLATAGIVAIPILSKIPVLGPALFAHSGATYLVYALVPAVWWWMRHTHAGLAVRAIGEQPAAAEAAGISVRRVRIVAVLAGGVMGGVAGATLVLTQAGTFVEGMSAGRGFIAIAIVVLGRWTPVGVGVASLVFGAATALQYLAQALGVALPYQLFLALPYLLTLAALAGFGGRAEPPATLARIQ